MRHHFFVNISPIFLVYFCFVLHVIVTEMCSLAVQPPNGVTRNLTEVFVFLRNNAQQTTEINRQIKSDTDDKMCLIAINDDDKAVAFGGRNPPGWVNVIDEVNYELTRIKARQSALREIQQKQLTNLDFSDDKVSTVGAQKIAELTEELTSMFGHCKRLIKLIDEEDTDKMAAFNKLRQNVVASLMLTLNTLMHEFRASQSTYLRHLDSRTSSLDTFVIKSNVPQSSSTTGANIDGALTNGMDEEGVEQQELTIDQIQYIMHSEHMSKERETEVLKISKSILELHSMFKDIASLVVDQGTVLDRIDYNVEQSVSRIKSAFNSVKKADKYQQQNKKMQLIVVLAAFAILLMLLIVLTKF